LLLLNNIATKSSRRSEEGARYQTDRLKNVIPGGGYGKNHHTKDTYMGQISEDGEDSKSR
jgi:hypothetical protein